MISNFIIGPEMVGTAGFEPAKIPSDPNRVLSQTELRPVILKYSIYQIKSNVKNFLVPQAGVEPASVDL